MKENDKRYRLLSNPRIAKGLIDEIDGDEKAPGLKIRRLTQEEYDALEIKDENTLYLITPEEEST